MHFTCLHKRVLHSWAMILIFIFVFVTQTLSHQVIAYIIHDENSQRDSEIMQQKQKAANEKKSMQAAAK